MSHPSPYPSPPYTHPDNPDFLRAQHLLPSAWHVIDQPSPPTLREILSAYRSKGDGDRDMLLAMLNAKSAEDQRIAALANLHQKLIEIPQPYVPRPHIHDHNPFPHPMAAPPHYHYPPPPPPPPLARVSPTSSPRDLALPSVQPPTNLNENTAQASAPNSNLNPRKRARTSRSPPPLKRRHSGQSSESTELPPSPPFSSPGRSTLGPELAAHPSSRDAMAIGSLLASDTQDQDVEWPSRTSCERDRDGAQRRSKAIAQESVSR